MILLALLICAATLIFCCYLWYQFNFNYWQKHNIPNVPGLFSGSFKDIIGLKTNFTLQTIKIFFDPKFKNEPVVGIYALHRPALLIRNHDLIKRIFITNFDCFRNRFSQCDPVHDPIGNGVMFFARNQLWKKQRLLTSPVFRSDNLKKNMYLLLQRIGQRLEENLQQHHKQASIIEVKELTSLFTAETINATVFGIDSNALKDPSAPFVTEMKRVTQFNFLRTFYFCLIFFIPKLCSLFRAKAFYRVTEQFARSSMQSAIEIRERSGLKRNDLIDVFVQLKREAKARCEDMSLFMDDIASQALMLLFAGYESSSNTMTRALYELAKNPEIQQRLRKELCQVWPTDSGEVTYESLSQLKYLDMVVSEVLRMYPVLAVLERAYAPSEGNVSYSLEPFCSFEIPNEMPVYISSYGLHYDPEQWPNPHEFDPDRFTVENQKTRHPMSFVPFGIGPRNCFGGSLGVLQVKIFLLHFLKNHYVRLCDRTKLNPILLEAKGAILVIKDRIHLEIIRDGMSINELAK